MKILRYCKMCKKYADQEIDINSVQFYDWMSGTDLEIAAPHLEPEEYSFLKGEFTEHCCASVSCNIGQDLAKRM